MPVQEFIFREEHDRGDSVTVKTKLHILNKQILVDKKLFFYPSKYWRRESFCLEQFV